MAGASIVQLIASRDQPGLGAAASWAKVRTNPPAGRAGRRKRAMSFALPNNSTNLSGQTALVTGASSGLGWRFAKVLASQGAAVALAARRAERREELAGEIRAAGGKAMPLAIDVTDAEQLKAAAPRIEAELGLVTILVNNAGIPDAERATKMPLELIDRVIDINIRAPYVLSCEVARRLIEA